jgi:arylsulfatase A-like enzyme
MRKNPWVPFDDLARVPFMAVGHDIVGGRRVGSPVQSFDFALTALEFAGVAAPNDLDFASRSLRGVLLDEPGSADPDRVVRCGTASRFPMIRHGDRKYLRNATHQCDAVLFDLATDPLEQVNLLAANPHAGDELAQVLDAVLAEPSLDAFDAGLRT